MIKAVIFDFGYTIINPITGILIDEAIETLESLHKKGLTLILVTATDYPRKRLRQVEDLGLKKYFDRVNTVSHKQGKEFKSIIEKFNFKPEEYLVVGDRPKSEIKVGNQLGMKTCRFLNGPRVNEKSDEQDEVPDYEIKKLSEVSNLV